MKPKHSRHDDIAYSVEHRYGKNVLAEVHVTRLEHPNWEARMACILIEKWGPVMAKHAGSDPTGRAFMKELHPTEIVEKCCDTAQLAVAEFRRRGWIMEIPSMEEAEEILKRTEDAEEA